MRAGGSCYVDADIDYSVSPVQEWDMVIATYVRAWDLELVRTIP